MPQNASDIKGAIRDVLGPLSLERGVELSETTELVTDLDLDSMRTMEVLLELEDRLDVSIPLNILPNVRTLADLERELDELTAS